MIRHGRLWCVLLMCLSIEMRTYAQDVAAPYLYYFSNILHAFVIERADGTDSRIFAQGVMPEEHNRVSGPGWSPSGEWFAWESYATRGPGDAQVSSWIMRADGSERLTLLDDIAGEVQQMYWSPVEDLLAVSIIPSNYPVNGVPRQVVLIDVDANTIVASYEIPVPDMDDSWSEAPRMSWSQDGRYLVFYAREGYTVPNRSLLLVSISRAGETVEQRLPFQTRIWLQGGQVAYVEPDSRQIIVLDSLTSEPTLFSLEGTQTAIYFVWNTTGEDAFLYACTPECRNQQSQYQLWLLGNSPDEISLLSNDVEFSALDPVGHANVDYWSPNGQYGVFGSEGNVFLVHPASLEIQPIQDVNNVTEWIWSPDSTQLYLWSGEYPDRALYQYDVDHQIISQVEIVPQFYATTVSPNNRYLTDVFTHGIFDIEMGDAIQFVPHSASAYAGPTTSSGFRWHPSSEWVLTGEGAFYAGGGGGPDGTGVFKLDGTMRRELGFCSFSSTCANWLPDNVIPHLAPGQETSVVPQPIMTLEHEYYIQGLAWSHDGRLASFDGSLHIWQFEDITVANEQRIQFDGQTFNCWDVCFLSWSPDDRFIALGHVDSHILIIDISSGEIVETVDSFYGEWAENNQFIALDSPLSNSPNREYTATINDTDNTVEIRSDDWVFTTPALNEPRMTTWSPDSHRLVIYQGNDYTLWNVEQQIMTPLESPIFRVMDVDLTNDRLVVTSYFDETGIWDTTTGQLVTRLNFFGRATEFSPDARWLAVGGSRVITIWDSSLW